MSSLKSVSLDEPVPPAPNKRRNLLIAATVVAAVATAGWVIMHWGQESTDDAQIDADVVPVPARLASVVTSIHFDDNQEVKAGDLLVQLDDAQARAKVLQSEAGLASATASASAADAEARVAEVNAYGNQAVAKAQVSSATASAAASAQEIREGEAAIASAKARYAIAKVELDRAESLMKTNAISQATYDQARAVADAQHGQLEEAEAKAMRLRSDSLEATSKISEAQANYKKADNVPAFLEQARAKALNAHAWVEMAKAQRDMAALELSYARIVAPQTGRISRRTAAVGQMLAAGQAVAQLVPSDKIWVTANFKETQIEHMRVGQKVEIEVDALGGSYRGEVESFSAATGARFALLPPDNATGNFTKVVQRLPVRIKLDAPSEQLRPGLSVVATVHTR